MNWLNKMNSNYFYLFTLKKKKVSLCDSEEKMEFWRIGTRINNVPFRFAFNYSPYKWNRVRNEDTPKNREIKTVGSI